MFLFFLEICLIVVCVVYTVLMFSFFVCSLFCRIFLLCMIPLLFLFVVFLYRFLSSGHVTVIVLWLYSFLSKAVVMLLLSSIVWSSSVNVHDHYVDVFTTLDSSTGWWCDYALRFLFVWVFFQYIMCPMAPHSFLISNISSNGNFCFTSTSVENLLRDGFGWESERPFELFLPFCQNIVHIS